MGERESGVHNGQQQIQGNTKEKEGKGRRQRPGKQTCQRYKCVHPDPYNNHIMPNNAPLYFTLIIASPLFHYFFYVAFCTEPVHSSSFVSSEFLREKKTLASSVGNK